MSERGSFVTDYIYCKACFDVAMDVLAKDEKYLHGDALKSYTGLPHETRQIVAGGIGGLYGGEELDVFREKLMPELARRICHPLRVAVLAEQGEEVFKVTPGLIQP